MARRGKIGALVTNARHDGRSLTAPARAAFLRKLEAEVDPDGLLTPEERSRRALFLRRAHLARAARASVLARSKKKAPTESQHPVEAVSEVGHDTRVPTA